MDKLEEFHYFTTPIYAVKKPEFLPSVKAISDKYLNKSRAHKKVKNPRTVMSPNYSHEPSIAEFAQYVSQTAWNILNAQGYNVDAKVTYFMEMWSHEHNLGSGIDKHMHGNGSQMSGFYFLDVPENSCKMVLHDSREAKQIVGLPMKDTTNVVPAADKVFFTPEAGTIILFNAWVNHSFTKNMNKTKPLRFVHMNISVAPTPSSTSKKNAIPKPTEPKVEVI
jgi:uncharacterized protein (TIGR02466 family)